MDPLTAIAERRRELDYKLMKRNMLRRRPVHLEALPEYRNRVEEKRSRGGGSSASVVYGT